MQHSWIFIPRVRGSDFTLNSPVCKLTNIVSGLHSTLSYHNINTVKNQARLDHSPGRIELCCFDSDPPKFITFGVLMGQKATVQSIDPQSSNPEPELGLQMQTQHLLDGDTEELSKKLEDYLKLMATQFFEEEPSHFMRATVRLAWELDQITSVSTSSYSIHGG